MFLGDLLEIKQPNKQKVIAQKEQFDLLHTIQECLEKVLILSNLKHIELSFKLDNESQQELFKSYFGDQHRMKQIVDNFLLKFVKNISNGSKVCLTLRIALKNRRISDISSLQDRVLFFDFEDKENPTTHELEMSIKSTCQMSYHEDSVVHQERDL